MIATVESIKSIFHSKFLIKVTFIIVLSCILGCTPQKAGHHVKVRKSKSNLSAKNSSKKLHTKKLDRFSLKDLFVNEQKQNQMKCPGKHKRKANDKTKLFAEGELIGERDGVERARIIRRSKTIEFDIVHVEEKRLDIPAFKQFRNNMTDFTADGEEQFQNIISLITEYLGDNTNGQGVTLYIQGSASQIPTSFDPSKPNNNINADGSSIKGRTSVENNRMLAHARADFLAQKIQEVFTQIKIISPSLSEISIGATPWTHKTQRELDKAFLAGDTVRMQNIFAPFQSEQYVLVESHETFVKTVQPKAIKMYTVSFVPRENFKDGEGETMIKSSVVVSKETFWKIGQNRTFQSVKERTNYLNKLELQLERTSIKGETRWYLLRSNTEGKALKLDDEYDKLYALYELGIVDDRDQQVLEKIITQKYIDENKYTYILKKDVSEQ